MFVIIGATGQVGSKIVSGLRKAGAEVGAIGRTPQNLEALKAQGATTLVGNLEDVAFLNEVFKGAQAAFLMTPPLYTVEDVEAQHRLVVDNLIEAVETNNISHVIALSSIGVHIRERNDLLFGLWYLEEKLSELHERKGTNVLILRAGYFMENNLSAVDMITNMGANYTGVHGDTKVPAVATQDIAQKVTEHLLKGDWKGLHTEYVLGPRDISFLEMTHILGSNLGKKDVQHVQVPYEQVSNSLVEYGFSQTGAKNMAEMHQNMNEGRLYDKDLERNEKNTTPTEYADFVRGVMATMHKA